MTIEDIPNAYDAGFATGEDEDVIIKVLGVGGGDVDARRGFERVEKGVGVDLAQHG